MFFPGLRRRACQEDVEASRPLAAPGGVADRRRQLWGTRAPRPCTEHRVPLPCPSPLPLLNSPLPDLDPEPTPSRGKGPGGRVSLGWGPWARCRGQNRNPVTACRPGLREGFPREADRPDLLPSLLWILSRASAARTPRGTSQGCFRRISSVLPNARPPFRIINLGLGREPRLSITYSVLHINGSLKTLRWLWGGHCNVSRLGLNPGSSTSQLCDLVQVTQSLCDLETFSEKWR